MLLLLLLGKIPQPCMAGEKLCLWSLTFSFFLRNISNYLYLLKIIIRVDFFRISSQNRNRNGNSQPCMAE